MLRIEILLFAGRIDDARRLLDRLPEDAAWARFEKAALRDLVDWRAGGDGDLPGWKRRLGRRADGQVGRAIRPRLLRVLPVIGLVLGVLGELLGTGPMLWF